MAQRRNHSRPFWSPLKRKGTSPSHHLSRGDPAKVDGCSLGTGTTIEIRGIWRPAPPGKEQSHELKADHVSIIGVADAEVRKLDRNLLCVLSFTVAFMWLL